MPTAAAQKRHSSNVSQMGEEWNVNPPAKARMSFPHHMIREIYEQPDAVRRVLSDHIDDHGTIRLPELPFTSDQIRSFSKITIAASGSSRHAGMVGEFMFERMAAIDVE